MVFDSHNRFIQNRPAANPTNGIWNKDVYKYPNKFVILSAMWRSKMEKTKNRAGKKERFEHIYKEYSKPMYLYALSFLVSEEEAEDAIQEVFINFWKDDTYQKIQNEVTNTVKTLLKNGMRHLRERFAERVDLFLIIVLIKKVGIQRKEKESFTE